MYRNNSSQENLPAISHQLQPDQSTCFNPFKMLSKQEIRCVFYLLQGKTAKEAAKLMGLSHRTIERYMDNIRKKTGLRKKGEILKLFESVRIRE